MGIDCQQGDANPVFRSVVLLDAFDGHACLPLVEHDGLVVEQAPAVANVGVQPRGIGAPARIHPGRPQMAAGVHGHHVGRALAAVAPERRDRQRVLVLRHPFVGPAQPAAQFDGPHRHGDVRRVDAGDHRPHALGVEIGAMGQERAVDGQQLVARRRTAGQQRLAEVGGGVDFQQQVWRLIWMAAAARRSCRNRSATAAMSSALRQNDCWTSNSDSLVGRFSAPMKRLAKDTVAPFGQSKPPIYLRRVLRESLPARWPARARDGLVSGNRVNLLERYDYPAPGAIGRTAHLCAWARRGGRAVRSGRRRTPVRSAASWPRPERDSSPGGRPGGRGQCPTTTSLIWITGCRSV
jgi:hypothetical protein